MKYVCTQCGRMLPVDRDLDDDRTFDYVVARHCEVECPHAFVSVEDVAWFRSRPNAGAKTVRR